MAEILKYADIKDWDGERFDARITQFRRELFNMRMQKAAEGVNKPHIQKVLKRNVARLLTAKRAKLQNNEVGHGRK